MMALLGGEEEKATPFANMMKGMQMGLAKKAAITKDAMEF